MESFNQISQQDGETPTAQLYPEYLGGNSSNNRIRAGILVNIRKLSHFEAKRIYENGTSGNLADLGTRTVLSHPTETKLLDHFYGNSGNRLVFGLTERISKDLEHNEIFILYHQRLMNRMANQVISDPSSSSKISDNVTSNFLLDKSSGGIGLIDFSKASQIPFYDFYGLIGGTQKIEIEMILSEKITKVPNNILYPLKAPIIYTNKATERNWRLITLFRIGMELTLTTFGTQKV